jgi:hypothetical protein
LLDIWFSSRLIAGNRLELRDGLLAGDEVAALVPNHFAGCLHLANCHSSLLQRTLASPLRRVLAQEDILLPRVFFEVYRTVESLLGTDGRSYPDLWISLLKDMRDVRVEVEHVGWLTTIHDFAKRVRKFF